MSITVITEWPLREGWEFSLYEKALLREGFRPQSITWKSLLPERPYAGSLASVGKERLAAAGDELTSALSSAGPTVLLPCGEYLLKLITGNSGIDKWQASVVPCAWGTAIPCYPPERVAQNLSLQLWVSLCARKAREEQQPKERKPYVHLLNPPLAETLDYLNDVVAKASLTALDLETGRGQINTIGFAVSPTEAIAINVLPDRFSAENYGRLWGSIGRILEDPERLKLLQNFIYETLYLSRYGIRLRGVTHDTMIAQKFLWPEFEMGLDAVGRMYSDQPYWKDDGKSWNNIRDWEQHYSYNCKDTCGTFAGYLGQTHDLRERGLLTLYQGYIRKLFPAVAEMCSRGLPVSPGRLRDLTLAVSDEYSAAVASLRSLPGAAEINPRSWQQVRKFLKAEPRSYSLPKKYNGKKKRSEESTDEKSLKKLRMKHPEDPALPALLKIAKLGKIQSSYLNAGWDKNDNRMRFSLTAGGTETMRFAGHCDPWDRGVNPQTVPSGSKGINVRSCFAAPEGFSLLEIDLRQAESRFVAYDAADANLIRMLEDPTKDIHCYVAAEIFQVPESEITNQQRQLGKKSGHGANYSMKEATFIDSCISEMDLVLSKQEATKVLEAYHKLFPGIRQWHAALRREVSQTRKLTTPWGWERVFWGRLDDTTFREAYAFRPQSTIPYVINQLMLHLCGLREKGDLAFNLLLQSHDSILLEVPSGQESVVMAAAERLDDWHPVIVLAGGRLRIPIEAKWGSVWGELKKWSKA